MADARADRPKIVAVIPIPTSRISRLQRRVTRFISAARHSGDRMGRNCLRDALLVSYMLYTVQIFRPYISRKILLRSSDVVSPTYSVDQTCGIVAIYGRQRSNSRTVDLGVECHPSSF